ncbi:MAG TPA: cation:proton antiporter [Thermoplasmata archaeon]|nr:cation:proton antiporter [Thermoplasmata archaeon]
MAEEVAFVTAAIILLIGFLGEALFRRTGFPSILLLIAFGIILGPVLGIFDSATLGPVTPHLITLALIMILFHGGLDMDLARAFGQSGRATALAVGYFLLVTAGVALAAHFLLGFDWTGSLLFGPMIAGTSSVVIIPLARKLGLREETSTTIALESTITDILNIVVFFALIDVYFGRSAGVIETFRDIAAKFGVGLLLGFFAGVLWLAVLYRIRYDEYTYIPTLAVVIFVFFGSEALGGSGVLSVLTMGLVLGNASHVAHFVRMKFDRGEFAEVRVYLLRFQSEISLLIRAFFFVFLGLMFDIGPTTLIFSLTYGLLFTAINVAGRSAAVVASTAKSPMAADRMPMTLLCGQGLAHATLAVIPLQLVASGQFVANASVYPTIVVMVILATNVITAIAAVATARRNSADAAFVPVSVSDPPPPPDGE